MFPLLNARYAKLMSMKSLAEVGLCPSRGAPRFDDEEGGDKGV